MITARVNQWYIVLVFLEICHHRPFPVEVTRATLKFQVSSSANFCSTMLLSGLEHHCNMCTAVLLAVGDFVWNVGHPRPSAMFLEANWEHLKH